MRLALPVLLSTALLIGGCGVRALRALPAPPAPQPVAHFAAGPVIQAFTANPGPVAKAGQVLTMHVVARDPADGVLRFHWTATGGTLSTDTGQLVSWHPPAEPGTYAVTVLVANSLGKTSTAVLNLRRVE